MVSDQHINRLTENINGLASVVLVLIGRLKADNHLEYATIRRDLENSYASMSSEDVASGAGEVYKWLIDSLHAVEQGQAPPSSRLH